MPDQVRHDDWETFYEFVKFLSEPWFQIRKMMWTGANAIKDAGLKREDIIEPGSYLCSLAYSPCYGCS